MKKIDVIEHEILMTLKNVGMTITQKGSEVEGHTALYVRLVETSSLQFGVLVALLNDPNFRPPAGQPTFLNQVKVTKEQVGENLKYSWAQVAEALEILESNGDIVNEVKGQLFDVEERRIKLTANGLKSFNDKYYIKQYTNEAQTKQLARSTVITNRWIIITAVLTFVVSSLTTLMAYWQLNDKNAVSRGDFKELIQSINQLNDHTGRRDSLILINDQMQLEKADSNSIKK